MVRLAVLACLVGACGFELRGSTASDAQLADGDPPSDVPAGHWLDGYMYRRPLELHSGQTAPLADFVVAIIVPEDAALAAHAAGDDLVVTAEDDTILAYDLERFDPATGALALWVRIPSLAPTTRAFLYYGGPAHPHDPKATWSAQVFRAVWHLDDAQPMQVRDAAGAHDLAPGTDAETPGAQAARCAGGRLFDGDDDVVRDDADDPTLDAGASSFSYSAWVRVTESAGLYDMALYKGGSSLASIGYDLELGTAQWRALLSDGSDNPDVSFGDETLGAWVHLVAVVDRQTDLLRAYKNGEEVNATDIEGLGSLDNSSRLSLGGNNNGSYSFRGLLDEPRVYARALEPAWIAAEYANLSAPAAFVTVGAEQTR